VLTDIGGVDSIQRSRATHASRHHQLPQQQQQ